MRFRLFLCALLAVTLAGCDTPYKKSDAQAKKDKLDMSKDPTFQSFVGRLRIAVKKRDQTMLSSMMTNDFGYRWDDGPPGDSPFAYWDKNNLWNELGDILKGNFVPNSPFMVAPAAVVDDPNYTGYRVGLRQVNGSWRFGYFVSAPPQ